MTIDNVLNEWLKLTEYRVTEGFENMWFSYGEKPWQLIYGPEGYVPAEEERSTHIVYDRVTGQVNELFVYDGPKDRPYRWQHPDIRHKYQAECMKRDIDDVFCDDTKYINLETTEDFFEKAAAILAGEEYDDRIDVPIDIEDGMFLALAREAHSRDITINQLIELALREAIDEAKTYEKAHAERNGF